MSLLSRRSAVVVGVAVLTSTVLAWPMLFTTSGLGGDWEHHLWYIWRQSLAIRADGVPSMFLNTNYSVFYPQYAFYGGTIYALAGTLALALGGSPLSAYVLTYILGFMAAYGGWYWTGRTLGLGRCLAQVPALVFVTSACYLTLVYGQGDWPAFLALSMLPFMVAAGLSVLRAERLRVLPAVTLAGSSIVFFGSHILTVLWASTLFGLTCVAVLVLVPEVRRQIRRRGLIRVAALMIPALLVNAWFLLPMTAYASHTRIGSRYGVAYRDLRATMHLVAFHHLFTLSRASTVPEDADYALPLPTLTIVWVLASIAILLGSARRGTWVRMLVIFAAITAGIVVLMTHVGLLLALPKPYTLLQFSYRLEGYVLMGVTAAVLVVLVLVRSGSKRLRLWTWTIVPIVILSVVGAIQQVSAYPRTAVARGVTFTSRAEAFAQVFDDYAYVPLPFVSEQRLPKLDISPGLIHGNRVAFTLHTRPGQLVATNIGGGPDLLHIDGARIAGTDQRSQLVLAIGSATSPSSVDPRTPVSTEHISISPAQSVPVVLGRLLTLVGVTILLMGLVALSVRSYRQRKGRWSSAALHGSDVSRTGESELQVESVDFGLL
jgi:hypothetical protein